jgi:hypothetical protein
MWKMIELKVPPPLQLEVNKLNITRMQAEFNALSLEEVSEVPRNKVIESESESGFGNA